MAFAIIIHLAVSAFAATVIANSTSDARTVDRTYSLVVGAPAPEDFFPVASGRFVGRQFIVLQHYGGQATILVVAEGWIAGRSDPDERMEFVEGMLDMTEIPWEEIDEKRGELGPQPISIRRLAVGPDESRIHVDLAMFTAPNKDSCIYALIGPPKGMREIREEVFGGY